MWKHGRSRALVAVLLAGATSLSPALADTSGPLSVPADGQAELDRVLEQTYGQVRPALEAEIRAEVAKLAGTTQGGHKIDSLDVDSLDVAAPPRIAITPIVTGMTKVLFFTFGHSHYGGELVTLEVPRSGSSWRVVLAGQIDGKATTITAENIRATDEVEIDTSDPTWPSVRKVGQINLDMDISIHTDSFWTNFLLFFAKPFVTKALKKPILNALSKVDKTLAAVQGLPGTPWGTGAPPRGSFGGTADLEKEALQTSSEIQTTHLPFGTILNAIMSDPNPGAGTPTGYFGHGDSACWTGHYLAGEAFRYAVTKDPVAQDNAVRAIEAIRDLFDVETPGGGLLARCRVPASSPDAADLVKEGASFQTTLNGVDYVCLENISRDQYTGVLHGLGVAYEQLDDPNAKAAAAELIGRAVDYYYSHGWCALRHDGVTVALPSPLAQGPLKIVAFSALAARVDGRFAALRDETAPLAYAQWFFSVTDALDPLGGYFKWNLDEAAMFHAMRLETDPGRYMALERAHAIDRRAIGHHENAYFQTIDVAIDPSLQPSLAPLVEDELQRFVARGRRARAVQLSADPNIEKAPYSSPISYTSVPGSVGTIGASTSDEAKYPVAVELRPCTDFLWQRDPFQLDGGGDPTQQYPGVDLVLPYWMARYYGALP